MFVPAVSRLELNIRRELLDWSAYHAAAAAACLRLNILVAIDPRLSKLKIWNLWEKKYFFIIFFLHRTIRFTVLIVNFFFV